LTSEGESEDEFAVGFRLGRNQTYSNNNNHASLPVAENSISNSVGVRPLDSNSSLPLATAVPVADGPGGVAAAANVPEIELVAQASSNTTTTTHVNASLQLPKLLVDIPQDNLQVVQQAWRSFHSLIHTSKPDWQINARDAVVGKAKGSGLHCVESQTTGFESVMAMLNIVPREYKPETQAGFEILVLAFNLFSLKRSLVYHFLALQSLGAPTILISTMKKWPQEELLQYYGCLCLVLLAFQNCPAKIMIARTGGIEVIVDAMKAHPSSKRLQYQACQALQNILANPEAQAIQAAATSFVDNYKGVTVVVTAMKSFMQDVALQLRGMTVFLNLVAFDSSGAFRSTMLKEGALSLVGTIVEHHTDNGDIKETAKLCMNKIMG